MEMQIDTIDNEVTETESNNGEVETDFWVAYQGLQPKPTDKKAFEYHYRVRVKHTGITMVPTLHHYVFRNLTLDANAQEFSVYMDSLEYTLKYGITKSLLSQKSHSSIEKLFNYYKAEITEFYDYFHLPRLPETELLHLRSY